MSKDRWLPINPNQNHSVLTVAGDTYFGEWYTRRRKKQGIDDALQTYGYGYSFEKVSPLLEDRSFNVVNFEAVLTHSTHSPIKDHFTYILSGRPEESVAELKRRNVHCVILANNHMMDYGSAGLRDTLAAFQKGGIHTIGAGGNLKEAQAPLCLEASGRRVVLFNCYWYRKKRDAISRHYADPHQGGTACVDRSCLDLLRVYRGQYPDAYLVVSPHWGLDFQPPLPVQREWAKRIIGAGADCILGHGSHIASECEWIDGKPVIYSLGNFVFNSNGNDFKKHAIPPYGTVAKLVFSSGGTRLRLYPLYLYNPECFWQPYPVTKTQFRQWQAFCKLSHLPVRQDELGYCLELNDS